MGIGDLKGRVIITNAASGPLRQVKADVDAIAAATKRISMAGFGQRLTNMSASARRQIESLERRSTLANANLQGLGANVRGIIDQTKDFNEAKFGYGFATITDHIKDGKLQLDGWRTNMNAVAKDAVLQARAFSTLPQVTMKAREEVEKLGFRGDDSRSMFGAAMSLHLSEPSSLSAGDAAKFLGSVFRAYEPQMRKDAAAKGVDPSDPKFREEYMKTMAAKAAIAGAESALGPADIVEGMRQFAPLWAGMGISYNFALAALAHGANFGFRAPELGTAYKSMANRAIRPTAEGMRWMNRLGIDRTQYMEMGVADPKRATNQLNALLGNALGAKDKKWLEGELIRGQKQGLTKDPDFRGALVNQLERRLGKGFVGRRSEIEGAYDDSFLAATKFKEGGFEGLIQAIIKSGAGPAAMGAILEGRHMARNDPMFKFYDQLHALSAKLMAANGGVMDAVVEGRTESEAGKTQRMMGSWQELMVKLEQSGGLIDKLKDAVIGLNTALTLLPADALNGMVAAVAGLAGIAGLVGAYRIGRAVLPLAKGAATLSGVPWAAGGVAAGTAGGALWARNAFLQARGLPVPTSAPTWATALGAGAAPGAAAAQASRLAMLGRVAMRTMPWLFAGYVGYKGVEGYQQNGWRGAMGNMFDAVNPLSMFVTPAQAAGAGGPMAGLGVDRRQAAEDEQGEALALAEQMRRMFEGVDLGEDGRRMMQGAEAGVREGTAALVAAMHDAAAQLRNAAANADAGPRGRGPLTVPLNTGPSMTGFP